MQIRTMWELQKKMVFQKVGQMRTKVFIDALNLGNLLLNDAVVTSFVTDVQDERADACSMKCKSTMKRLLTAR